MALHLKLNRRNFLATSSALLATTALPQILSAKVRDPYARLDALAQADLVRRKEARPVELVQAAIRRIEALNPKLNAVVTKFFDQAIEKAKGNVGSGPFAGVPYLIKDLTDYKGHRTTFGARMFAKNISKWQPPYIDAVDKSGVLVLGKTNTPEFGFSVTTEPLLFGPTRNPWNLDYSAGGSSGGAAAAVASGMLPFAHGSDAGGSIRVPASVCGLFGFKPSQFRSVPNGVKSPGDLAVMNCVSRSVRDSAAMIAATEDRGGKAKFAPIGFVRGPSSKRLKVGYFTMGTQNTDAHPDVKAAIENTAKLLEGNRHKVEPMSLPLNGPEFYEHLVFAFAFFADFFAGQYKKYSGKAPDESVFEPWSLGLIKLFKDGGGAQKLPKTLAYFAATKRKMEALFESYDVLLSPVVRYPAPKVGDQSPQVAFDKLYARIADWLAYTPLQNVTHQPAMSVPLHWSRNGLPIGSQLWGKAGSDGMLLALAYELEQSKPWAAKRALVSL